MGRTHSGISRSPLEDVKKVKSVSGQDDLLGVTAWHLQGWPCSSLSFSWQPGSGSLCQDLCRAVGWVLGQEQQEPLEAQQGTAQVEPSRGCSSLNCQQQSWHTAHCLLLITAFFSRVRLILCSSEG